MTRAAKAGAVVAVLVVSSVAGWRAGGVWQRAQAQRVNAAIAACDIAWQRCRAASGNPVKDATGCEWGRLEDGSYVFAHLTAAGWQKCSQEPEPDELQEEDESPCSKTWAACYTSATGGAR